MDRETYIAPIVESYIPDAEPNEKLELTGQFLELFERLANIKKTYRFDSPHAKMLESESDDRAGHHTSP